jgi:membrane protein DedA with SNARE-associated domain
MTLIHLSQLVATYGYVGVFAVVLVASAGIPVPAGELLVAAAVYAAHTHKLSIVGLVIVGALGAVLGGGLGYGIGRSVGAATLHRYGGLVGLGPARLRLGEYLFRTHGGKIVFFLRFVALLGPFGGVLAGVNRMPWGRFLLFNTLGGVAWASVAGVGGYVFGAFFKAVGRPVGLAMLVLTIALVVGLLAWLHRHERVLQKEADDLLLPERRV